jgi:Amidohydrolase family
MRRPSALLLALAFVAASAAAQDAPASRSLAIRVKRALTVSGAPIDDATILVENGRISAIGASSSVDVPEDADVLDAGAMWATPGFVHPVALAMGPSGTYEVSGRSNTADRIVAEDLAPTWPGVRSLAKAGFARVNVILSSGGFAGQSVLIRPIAKLDRPVRAADLVVAREHALCMAFEPRTTTKALWKETLAKVKKYREDKAAGISSRPESAPASRPQGESRPATESRPASRPSEPAADPKLMPLVEVFEAKMPGILVLNSAASLLHLMPILQEHPDFKPALFLQMDDAWRVVDEVKKLGYAVVLQPNRVNKPDTNIEIVPVRDYVDAGIPVALIPETNFTQQYEGFPFHLAELVRKGVSRDAVLRGATLTAAEVAGIQKDVGSLEKGKAGDVLLWTADPLSPEAGLARVIIGGATVYDAKGTP